MSAMLSLCAVMRVVGVGAFGSLYTYGSRLALPELPYYVFALVQLGTLACILPIKWGSDAEEQEVKQEVKQAKVRTATQRTDLKKEKKSNAVRKPAAMKLSDD